MTQMMIGGCRDIEAFNDAMLAAKQMWKLIREPDSFVARVLKAKYFHDCNVLHAGLVQRPSYVWHSLWEAKHVILKGLYWLISNGVGISVWYSCWIPRQSTSNVVLSMKVAWEDATVADFIYFDIGVWREGLLRDVFLPCDVEVISKIPMSRLWPLDQFVCHYSFMNNLLSDSRII